MSDRGYINLIRHLTRATSTLPLETIQASIAHYLARPPQPIPGSPTALTAAVLGSPYFRPYSYAKLAALSVAFRHAVHMRVAMHREEAESPASVLPPSRGVNVPGRLGKWCRLVSEGFSGSPPVVRLACASGMLLGLEDWEAKLEMKAKEARVRAKAEEEVVLALAEVVDTYARDASGWETDFMKKVEGTVVEEDPLGLAVLLASQCAAIIASQRLQALPLPTIIDVLVTTIERSFHGGAFLAGGSASTDAQEKLTISRGTVFARTVNTIAGSTYIASMSSLSKFTALALTTLIESRRAAGWDAIGSTLSRLRTLTARVESDWSRCALAGICDDSELAKDGTREVATSVWQVLKTLLFTTLMILQSVLSAVVWIPSPHTEGSAGSSSQEVSPYVIALDALHTLSHLSFVMPQFGGVASTSEGGLPELKRAFYMAMDVLSESESESGRFVEDLCQNNATGKGKEVAVLPRALSDAKKAFALACIEQLVPVLSEMTIQSQVYPLCYQHLWDPRHRETYESAHSVMLAIFASHAQGASARRASKQGSNDSFAEKIVPMYARCLVENSFDGRLSTTQLSMAYAALVRSASSFGYSTAPAAQESVHVQADSMAWFCIEVLLDAIRHARAAPAIANMPFSPRAQPASSSSSSSSDLSEVPTEHLQRLHLTLVATVPSVSRTLLPRLLTEVKAMIISVSPRVMKESDAGPAADDTRIEEMRAELVDALFRVISQDVGDAEKDYAIDWWYEHREQLVHSRPPSRHPVFDGAEALATSSAPDVISRL